MLSLIGGFVLKLFSGPIAKFLEQREVTKRDTALAGVGADKERDLATIAAVVDANRYRGAQQTSFWPLVYIIALPPALHAGAVYLDSMPLWLPFVGQHVVGSWGIALPPGDYATMQTEVLKSFFYVAPVVAGARVLGAAIARR